MEVLNYGQNNYVIYDKIFNENPLHFDGISTLDKKRIPDHLFLHVKMKFLLQKKVNLKF